ncbi:tetratricopeptide repeat protein [Ekhidna sp.]|uniref:tetratricopeptide repeat protein n=1 Tax=Ekhidna sp. TaxID=2608089 RepID=UPI003C7EC6AE
MNKITNLFLLTAFLYSCTESKSTTENVQIIKSLENKIDSLGMAFETESAVQLSDSLLNYDPNNYIALGTIGINAFNNRDAVTAIKYLSKLVKIKPESPMHKVFLGLCHEQLMENDLALKYYQQALEPDSIEWPANFMKIRVKTVVHGKEAGFQELQLYKESLNPIDYHQLNNDIKNYNEDGLNSFYPPWFDSTERTKFLVTIPDELYNSGQINSMEKVELVFAKLGVNISCIHTNSQSKDYKISTTDKYLDKLIATDTLNLKKL